MLDRDTIAQLSQLKKDILSTKDYAEGIVTGTSGRYGFVKLDDGRSAFLNPEKMMHLLPGDRVRVNVVTNDKEQLEGELEKLISSDLKRFIGRYKIKGNAHFVVPEGQTRWIFIPHQFRTKCREDDLIQAEIVHHPYADGKAAAKTLARIGADGEDYLYQNLTIARFDLHRYWSKDAQKQVRECQEKMCSLPGTDMTGTAFVTIDSASTRDMDDALFAEARADGGWHLAVAIANPASFINPGSPIAKSARFHGQSVYLPGISLSMLPEKLATDTFSLVAGEERPALVCHVDIAADGSIEQYRFEHAKIRSRAKLSYVSVAAFLDTGTAADTDEITDELAGVLVQLDRIARVRYAYRRVHNLVFPDQREYDYQINKRGLIEAITPRNRNVAHRLVEETMVATNLCAAQFLAENKAGIFSVNGGFRKERLGEVKALLREAFDADRHYDELETLDGYLKLIKALEASPAHASLLPALKRMMQPTELHTSPQPHMSMGFACYAPITSPIRRFADLANHWSILQILNGLKVQTMPDTMLALLSDSISNGRQAVRQLEQTLWALYLQDRPGLQDRAVIRIVTQQGFGVRLLETGIEGFVQFPKKQEKIFDAKRMTLTVDNCCYALDQEVDVTVASVDLEKRRVKLKLTAADGAKAVPDA